MNQNIKFEKSALVVAHPDDEILWFSSVIDFVDKIIIIYNGTSNKEVLLGRNKIFNSKILPYQEKVKCLKIEEADVFNKSNWDFPKLTSYGVKLNSKKYIQNFDEIKEKLSEELLDYQNIITHNPWGEYGHEEHIQVFNAISKVSEKINFAVWVSSYFSEQSLKTMSLFKNLISKETYRFEINKDICEKVKSIYISNKAWTWSENYEWPKHESFFKLNFNFSKLNVVQNKIPEIWSDMNFILIHYVHLTKFSIIRSKIIQLLKTILPESIFSLLIKIKKKNEISK